MFRKKRTVSIVFTTLLLSLFVSGMMFECEAKSEELVTITFTPQKDITPAAKATIEAFEKKYPNIKVNYQELPSSVDTTHNSYVTALSAGDSSVDVLQVDVTWAPEFISAGWVLPLNNLFTKAEQRKFLARTVQAMTYKGKIGAVPFTTEIGVLYYRTDIIKTPPKTWDELIRMCKENMGKNGIKNGFVFQGMQYEGFVCDILEFIHSNGGSIIKGNKITVNSPQVIQGLQYMKDIINENLAPSGITTYKESDALAVFQQGNALFMRNWCFDWALLNKDDSIVKGKVGVVPIPLGKDGQEHSGILGGWSLAINKYSKHPKEAWKFIQFATSEETQKMRMLLGGKLPTRQALYQDKNILAQNPHFKDFYNAFQTAAARPLSPVYPKISDTMQINFHKAVNGLIPIKDAVRNVEKDLRQIVK